MSKCGCILKDSFYHFSKALFCGFILVHCVIPPSTSQVPHSKIVASLVSFCSHGYGLLVVLDDDGVLE